MKKIFFFLMIMGFVTSYSFAQTTNPDKKQETKVETVEETTKKVADGPVMQLESKVVDYGEITQHGEPLRKLTFTNVGNAPLVIKNARGSCGCTVPTWPKEPLMPGEQADIEIRYSTNRLGKINKTVTITTNEVYSPKHVIKVIGMIHKEEEGIPASKPNVLGGKG